MLNMYVHEIKEGRSVYVSDWASRLTGSKGGVKPIAQHPTQTNIILHTDCLSAAAKFLGFVIVRYSLVHIDTN